jgi:four helix bundle protein
MAENRVVKSFRDLIVYQKTAALSAEIFRLTRTFPREEAYSLTDQVRRSSRSVGAHIAEAWALRAYERHFVSKLTNADAERMETQHWVDTAMRCDYLTAEEGARLDASLAEIGRMLWATIHKASSFCTPSAGSVREEAAKYVIDDPQPDEDC